jgi:hypothetical protein
MPVNSSTPLSVTRELRMTMDRQAYIEILEVFSTLGRIYVFLL